MSQVSGTCRKSSVQHKQNVRMPDRGIVPRLTTVRKTAQELQHRTNEPNQQQTPNTHNTHTPNKRRSTVPPSCVKPNQKADCRPGAGVARLPHLHTLFVFYVWLRSRKMTHWQQALKINTHCQAMRNTSCTAYNAFTRAAEVHCTAWTRYTVHGHHTPDFNYLQNTQHNSSRLELIKTPLISLR
jgi:hypothetical protein